MQLVEKKGTTFTIGNYIDTYTAAIRVGICSRTFHADVGDREKKREQDNDQWNDIKG